MQVILEPLMPYNYGNKVFLDLPQRSIRTFFALGTYLAGKFLLIQLTILSISRSLAHSDLITGMLLSTQVVSYVICRYVTVLLPLCARLLIEPIRYPGDRQSGLGPLRTLRKLL